MKRHIEFWIFVVIALALAWFGFTSVSHAATIQQTQNTTATSTTQNFFQGINVEFDNSRNITSKTFDLSGTISSITVRIDPPDSGTPQHKIGLFRSNTSCAVGQSPSAVQVREEESFTSFVGSGEQDITFSFTPHSFVTGECYVINVQLSGYPALYDVRGSYGDPWEFGYYDGADYDISNNFDAYFVTDGTYSTGDSIEITSPQNNATSTVQSDLWTINVSLATTTSGYYHSELQYKTATSTFGEPSFNSSTGSWEFDGYGGGFAGSVSVGSNDLLSTLYLDTNTTYYAKAYLIYHPTSGNTSLVASSTSIAFTTGFHPQSSGASGSWSVPTSTATSSEWVITCDPESSYFVNSLCNLSLALFIPKTSDLERFKALYDDIKDKPPLGYYGLVSTAINSLSTSTTSTFALADLSSIQGTFLSPLKTGVSALLWLIFTFWLFHRFRHFEL